VAKKCWWRWGWDSRSSAAVAAARVRARWARRRPSAWRGPIRSRRRAPVAPQAEPVRSAAFHALGFDARAQRASGADRSGRCARRRDARAARRRGAALLRPRRATALELVREQRVVRLDAHARTKTTLQRRLAASSRPRSGALRARARDGLRASAHGRATAGEPRRSGERRLVRARRGLEGVLEGACDGSRDELRAVRTPADEFVLELWRERELRGVVLGPDGAPVGAGRARALGIQTPHYSRKGAWTTRTRRAFTRLGAGRHRRLGAWPPAISRCERRRSTARVGRVSVTAAARSSARWDTRRDVTYPSIPRGRRARPSARDLGACPRSNFFDAASGATSRPSASDPRSARVLRRARGVLELGARSRSQAAGLAWSGKSEGTRPRVDVAISARRTIRRCRVARGKATSTRSKGAVAGRRSGARAGVEVAPGFACRPRPAFGVTSTGDRSRN